MLSSPLCISHPLISRDSTPARSRVTSYSRRAYSPSSTKLTRFVSSWIPCWNQTGAKLHQLEVAMISSSASHHSLRVCTECFHLGEQPYSLIPRPCALTSVVFALGRWRSPASCTRSIFTKYLNALDCIWPQASKHVCKHTSAMQSRLAQARPN